MKQLPLLIIAFIIGCTSSRPVTHTVAKKSTHKKVNVVYTYEMVSPKKSNVLLFEDSSISASFTILSNEIDFTVKNKLNDPIKLIWDDASMVVLGSSERVMHKGVKYIDRSASMPPSTILPKSILDDLVLPSSNIYYREGYYGRYVSTPGGWETKPLLITSLSLPQDSSLINALKDQTINLYLPISDMNNHRLGYTFEFKVSDVATK